MRLAEVCDAVSGLANRRGLQYAAAGLFVLKVNIDLETPGQRFAMRALALGVNVVVQHE